MILAKHTVTFCGHECSTTAWNALNETLQQNTPLSVEARQRRKAIARIMRSADCRTKISVADWLLFADDISEAHNAIVKVAARANPSSPLQWSLKGRSQ